MDDEAPEGARARRDFLMTQVGNLEPLGFVVVGLPDAPFDAVQARREDDDAFVVELATRDDTAPFTDEQAAGIAALGFASEGDTWVAPAVAGAAAAVDLVERLLGDVLGVDPATAVDVRHGTVRDERAAEAKLASMREFLEPALHTIVGGEVPKDPDGDYLVDIGRTRVFVAPRAFPGRPPIVRVFSITNAGLNLTPELGLFLARLNFSLAFGRFSIDTDRRAVWFDETLLGDHVTHDELAFVVNVVAHTAGEWDEKIASMFGGTYRAEPGGDGSAGPDTSAAAAKPGQGGYL
ncbi:MAG TPA: YbjN domain-containing protein [Acidimicrobiales bacterium]